MPRRVGEGVEAEVAGSSSDQNVRGFLRLFNGHPTLRRMVHCGNDVAEDAVAVLGTRPRPCAQRFRHTWVGRFMGAADVIVAPRCPETFHSPEYRSMPPEPR